MIDLIRPRWWFAAAIAAFAVGVVGLYIGWQRWGSIAILIGEILLILASITFTTPSISASLAAQHTAPAGNAELPADPHEAALAQDQPVRSNDLRS